MKINKLILTIFVGMLFITVMGIQIGVFADSGDNECSSCCFCMNNGTPANYCEVASGTGRTLCMSGYLYCGFGATVCCGGAEVCEGQ